MKKVLVIFGTRPEAIKMCPLVLELKKSEKLATLVCVTGQHREMLKQVLDIFKVVPDYDMAIMKKGQDLTAIFFIVILQCLLIKWQCGKMQQTDPAVLSDLPYHVNSILMNLKYFLHPLPLFCILTAKH